MDSKKCEDSFENIASTSKDTPSQESNERSKNRMKRKSSTAQQWDKRTKKVRRVQEGNQGRIPTQESDFFGECDGCGKSFKRRHYLINHIKRKHSNKRDKVCITCGKRFAIGTDLKKHMNYVHSISLIKCEICGRFYKNMHIYSDHMRNVHKSKCPCYVCGKEVVPYKLKAHLQRHKDSRQFTCPVCGKMFDTKYNLQQHVLIHTGKKYYECFCGKSFTAEPGLYHHRKKMHIKPFPPMPTIPLDGIIEDFLKECETTMRLEKN